MGQYKWKNGSIYIGEFHEGQKHGKGKWKKRFNAVNCNTYEGSYENDKKNGLGNFTWESGNVYKGNYKEDERHGYGEMYWVDGSCYKGEWQKGIQHGVGRMELPDGRIKEGFFENNVFKGPVETPKMQQLKAQELLMNDMRTPTNIRVKSRGQSFPRPNLENTTRLPNKLETIEVKKINAN